MYRCGFFSLWSDFLYPLYCCMLISTNKYFSGYYAVIFRDVKYCSDKNWVNIEGRDEKERRSLLPADDCKVSVSFEIFFAQHDVLNDSFNTFLAQNIWNIFDRHVDEVVPCRLGWIFWSDYKNSVQFDIPKCVFVDYVSLIVKFELANPQSSGQQGSKKLFVICQTSTKLQVFFCEYHNPGNDLTAIKAPTMTGTQPPSAKIYNHRPLICF